MNRILFEGREVDTGGRITLPRNDSRAKHIRKVLKLEAGDSFDAGVVNGAPGRATVTELRRDTVSLEFTPSDAEPVPTFPITLLLAHPRPIVLRRMLKDLTTLGVERIDVFLAKRGEASYAEATIWQGETIHSILIDGAMQAGVTRLPDVRRYSGLDELLSALPPPEKADLLLFADESVSPADGLLPWLCARSPIPPASSARIAIGPERGWDYGERRLLEEAGFTPLSLGPRVLRTETAALVVTAAVAGEYVSSEDSGESSE